MIHEQENSDHHKAGPRFYAYCPCGVCGPLRRYREDARWDELAHKSVCTERASDER